MKVVIIIIGIILLIAVVLFSISSVVLSNELKKEIDDKNAQIKEAQEHAEKTAEVITDANKTKADARTGDRKRDINYMADKLHEYAKK